ncbi:MAG: peptide chain release factor N(5)-glutamine methyltransferase, partial [Gammaproteobacteria bacterium]|nr:peptide chain release factor N(5)-glutamine methyltransferase [Gammaproteobacteria bacterium]
DWKITAIDNSQACIDLALLNQKQLDITNIELFKSDWYDAIPAQKFSIIVANPPYIDSNDPHLEMGDVRFEPKSSLVADDKGLSDLLTIIKGAQKYLRPAGRIFLEHGYDQATAVMQLLGENSFQQIQSHQDLNKNDRVCSAIWA